MNETQLKCFLALADTLNFTKAAERMYISQPGLSKQIVALEREMNTQLVIRDQKNVRLTPAGVTLAGELPGLQRQWNMLVEKVQHSGMGYSGSLVLGILEGQLVGDELTDCCRSFIEKYPNIDLQTKLGSFGQLRKMLLSREVDAIITMKFDLNGVDGLICRDYQKDAAVFAVSRRLPIAEKERITLEDFKNETLILQSAEDCPIGTELTRKMLLENGITPRSIKYAPNLSTSMLWIESGLGIGTISYHSRIASSSSIRLISEIPLGDDPSCIAWRRDNYNPTIPLFTHILHSSEKNESAS